MRRFIYKIGIAVTISSLFIACDLSQLTKANAAKVDDALTQPKTEATVMGFWRSNLPDTTTHPATEIKVTLDVRADHTSLLALIRPTGLAAPNDNLEIVREDWSWQVKDGYFVGTKTKCTYKDPKNPSVDVTTCKEPTAISLDINVIGSLWASKLDGNAFAFRKN